jgi:hypothetical protein
MKIWPWLALVMCALGLCSGSAFAQPQCFVTKTFNKFDPASDSAPTLANPLAPSLKSTLKIVVLGDSVMWGDGLKPKEKFVALFGQNLANLTGRSVLVTSFAHSGARLHHIDDPHSTLNFVGGQPQGDLDSERPTTEEQSDCAAAQQPDAEIVLLDGCINDVGATKIALPFPFNWTPKETIADDTAACGPEMNALLGRVTTQFKYATIAVVNYYRVVSKDSTVLFAAQVNGAPPVQKKGSSPSQVDRLAQEQNKLLYMSGKNQQLMNLPLSQTAQENGREAALQLWDTNSEAFLSTSQTCFNWSIGGVDKESGGSDPPKCAPLYPPPNHAVALSYVGLASADSRVFLATVPDDPEYAFGARHTHLWHLPVRFLFWTFADDMYSTRKKLCKQAFTDTAEQYKCSINAIAHPNVTGAQFYDRSLVTLFKTAWATSTPAVAKTQ